MRYSFILVQLLFVFFTGYSQGDTNLRTLEKRADSLYNEGDYIHAINHYLTVAHQTDFSAKKSYLYYNIGCCFSLQGKYDSAFYYLKKAIENGYDDKSHMLVDKDLVKMHNLSGWKPLINRVKSTKSLNADPVKVHFHTEDIHHFWAAYDRAIHDTADFKPIFKQMYFDVASQGLKEYLGARGSSIEDFLATIRSKPKYYSAIRKNTFQADKLKPSYTAIFKQLKALYTPAVFPDIYFLMGAFSTGGTATHAGLLINMDQTAKDATIPLDELSPKNKSGLDEIANLPLAVAHELIHYQQDNMNMNDTTVLGRSIIEGMADFLAELTGPRPDSLPHYKWANGNEKKVWKKFKEEMYTGNFRWWILTSENATENNPAMQGYWVGYQICKAYYQKAPDKQKAIYDMLHTQDYKRFLAQSGWSEKMQSGY